MGRVLTVTKDSTLAEEYQYNANGTRIYEMNSLRGIAGRNFSYDNEDHLLIAGSAVYSYNLDGFLTAKTEGSDVTTYDYSSRGELLTAMLPDDRIIEYVHDPLGRRIAKKVNGTITEKYFWQGLTQLLAMYDGSSNLLMRFEYADGRMPVAMTKGGSTYSLTYDQVGSLRIVADASGNVVKRIDFDSFGNIIEDTDPDFEVPFGFAGGLGDQDTGLVRFGFRDYDPDTGRWTAKDPIFFVGGDTDLYGCCLNNPINLIDPLGLEFSDILPGIKKAIVEGAKGSAYAVSEAAKATSDIALNAHPLAQTALGVAFFSEAAPLLGAATISAYPAVTSAAYNIAPYSGAIVNFTYGWFTQTGPPQGLSGVIGSIARWVFEIYNDYLSSPCK
jgi:RHS repeat-associated protein